MIHTIPILRDNYAYVIENNEGECVIIDCGEAAPIITFIKDNELKPVAVFSTHHHGDHVAGNKDIYDLFDCPIVVPKSESHLIAPHTHKVMDGDMIEYAGFRFKVTETIGHTNGHVIFYCEELKALFCGDTLFSMGCGRLMEGTAQDMYESLQKIKSYPKDTMIYCGHEYTLTNSFFGLTIEPDNLDIQTRMKDVRELRTQSKPTIPVLLETELKTNVFLRALTVQDFADMRSRKDKF